MKTQVKLFTKEPKQMRMAQSETPTGRTILQGAGSLSYQELLAVLLNDAPNSIEIADVITDRWKTPASLRSASVKDLQSIYSVGEKRAARIIAALDIAGRALRGDADRIHVHTPQDIADFVMYDMMALDHEEIWIILMDTRNHLLDINKIYRGTKNQSTTNPAELLRVPIVANAASFILVHNHPSGDPTPSPEDVGMTRNLVDAAKLLNIDFLDHIIIGSGKFVSMKERGLAFR